MLQLSIPAQLFRHQTIYRFNANVDKKLTGASFSTLVAVLPQALSDLKPELKEMMEKLIAACKIQTGEVTYLDSSSSNCSFLSIQTAYMPKAIIFFGNSAISRNISSLKKNTPYCINGTRVLAAHAPEYLFKSKPEKAALWDGLQRMFKL